MSNQANPKSLFMDGTDHSVTLNTMVKSPALRFAVVFSIAEMASRGATHEQISGAKMFSDILLNLGEPPQPAPTYPDKTLQHL